jgi:hypothetical protein
MKDVFARILFDTVHLAKTKEDYSLLYLNTILCDCHPALMSTCNELLTLARPRSHDEHTKGNICHDCLGIAL